VLLLAMAGPRSLATVSASARRPPAATRGPGGTAAGAGRGRGLDDRHRRARDAGALGRDPPALEDGLSFAPPRRRRNIPTPCSGREGGDVQGDVGRSARRPGVPFDVNDGDRRLRGDSRGVSPDVVVEHHVADDQNAQAADLLEESPAFLGEMDIRGGGAHYRGTARKPSLSRLG